MNTEDTARIVQDHLHCQEVYTGGEYEAMNCGLRLPEPHGDADFRACHIAEALTEGKNR